MILILEINHPSFISEEAIERQISSVLNLEARRGDFKVKVKNGSATELNEPKTDTKILMARD